jgi:hypothetical protein
MSPGSKNGTWGTRPEEIWSRMEGTMLRKIQILKFLVPAAASLVTLIACGIFLHYLATSRAQEMHRLEDIRSRFDQQEQMLSKLETSNANPAEMAAMRAQMALNEEKYHEIESSEVGLTDERNTLALGTSGLLLVGLTITFVLVYLRPSERSLVSPSMAPASYLSEELADVRKLIATEREARAGFDKGELLSSLRSSVAGELAGELQARFRSEAQESVFSSLMRDIYKSDCERLFDQIALLRKRGNVNLALGVSITLFAAGVLVWALPPVNSEFGKTTEMLSYYIPRISTIAFIEVFAFFFLRLYKATLAEEKFYQNELTSRTARQTALEAAFRFKEPGPMATVIGNLSLVDQNKIFPSPTSESQSPDIKDLGKLLEGVAKVISATASKASAPG